MKALATPTAAILLTLPAAAERLCLSRRTLGRLIDSGAIPVIHLSPRRYAIQSADVDAYIQRSRREACHSGTSSKKAAGAYVFGAADKKLGEFCRKGRRDRKPKPSTPDCSENTLKSQPLAESRVIPFPTR